jgi:nicotinate-nucleotide pyrophosphorylase (carboxylating)
MRPPDSMADDVARALAEDLGDGDVTADLIPTTRHARATLITRDPMVLAGRPYMTETFHQIDPTVAITWYANEGDWLQEGACIATCEGPARSLLTGERTALNFVQCLSAVATKTRQLSRLLDGTAARLFDTRKTLPGLRMAQKYAVRVGGGLNHRIGLFDQVLIKENHITAAGGLTAAVKAAKVLHPNIKIQVEVETLAELYEAFDAQPDIIMLDNFDSDGLRFAVQERMKQGLTEIELEASGGITENNLAAIGATGVDRISLGTLTKDISAIDLSMRVELS